jgi:hypothetical protein
VKLTNQELEQLFRGRLEKCKDLAEAVRKLAELQLRGPIRDDTKRFAEKLEQLTKEFEMTLREIEKLPGNSRGSH